MLVLTATATAGAAAPSAHPSANNRAVLEWDPPAPVAGLPAAISAYGDRKATCDVAKAYCAAKRRHAAPSAAPPAECAEASVACPPPPLGAPIPGPEPVFDPLLALLQAEPLARETHLRPGIDALEFEGESANVLGDTVVYQHWTRVGDTLLVVAGSTVVFYLTKDRVHVREVANRVDVPTSAVAPPKLAADQARHALRTFLLARGLHRDVLDAVGNDIDATPVVLVEHRKGRVAYNMRVRHVPALSDTIYVVDGTTGTMIGNAAPPSDQRRAPLDQIRLPAATRADAGEASPKTVPRGSPRSHCACLAAGHGRDTPAPVLAVTLTYLVARWRRRTSLLRRER